MEEDRLAKWLAETYKNGHPDKETDLADIINTVDQLSIDPIDENQLLEKIQLNRYKLNQPKKTYTLKWISGIAASIALIIGFNIFPNQHTSISSPIQETSLHTLPDGSSIKLNSNSTIDYDSKFDERELTLKGEAFFEVKKGSNFIVNTDHGNIKVLGTSFNIFSRDSFLIVSCATGKVQVNTTMDSQLLLPGQKATLSGGKLILDSVNSDLIHNWKGAETTFEKTSLSIVISSLSHYYNLRVINKSVDISLLQFTGSFLHNDLEKAVKMILIPFNIKHEIVGNKELILYQ